MGCIVRDGLRDCEEVGGRVDFWEDEGGDEVWGEGGEEGAEVVEGFWLSVDADGEFGAILCSAAKGTP